jgi:hypothetical protein
MNPANCMFRRNWAFGPSWSAGSGTGHHLEEKTIGIGERRNLFVKAADRSTVLDAVPEQPFEPESQ